MKYTVTVLMGLLFSFNASASGGFACEVQQHGIDFAIGGVTSRGFQSAIVSADGHMRSEMGDDGSVMRFDHKYSRADIMQYWNMGNEFRLALYVEKEVGNTIKSLSVTIKTVSQDGIDFVGTATFEYFGPDGNWTVEDAPVTCGVE